MTYEPTEGKRIMNGDSINTLDYADLAVSSWISQNTPVTEVTAPSISWHLLARVLAHSEDPILMTDGLGIIRVANHAFSKMIGITDAQVIGQSLGALEIKPQDKSIQDLAQMLLTRCPWSGNVTLRHAHGSPLHLMMKMEPSHPERGGAAGMVISFGSPSRQPRMTPRVQFRDHQDPLTGLHNRAYFELGFSRHLTLARRSNSQLAVVYLDLNNLKKINDRLGHAAGDLVLQEASRRLAATLGPQHLLARLGGDEFAAIMPYTDASLAVRTAEAILFAFHQPMLIKEVQYRLSASIGIALYPFHGEEASVLLANADEAMYQAKALGGNRWQCYEPEARAKLQRRNRVINAISRPDEEAGFSLTFKPVFDTADIQHLHSLEILLEWSDHGSDTANEREMRKIAEQSGQIQQLDRLLHDRLLQQYQDWKSANQPLPSISMTLSYRSLLEPYFAVNFLQRNHAAGLQPHLLCIALTEAELIENASDLVEPLQILKSAGVSLAMSEVDFSKATLQHLVRIPLGFLKIAPQLIEGTDQDNDKGDLTRAIISTGAALHLRVIAAGVQTRNEMSWLRGAGCPEAQGPFLSPPLTKDTLAQLLRPTQGVERRIDKPQKFKISVP